MAEWVTLAEDDGVAVITPARPPVNAMSRAFMAELGAAHSSGDAYPTQDARAGIQAFLDKRRARFRGR
jgi:enoyl-CoA hydratase/carnithine racemase